MKKVVLITGASSGIGMETAIMLLRMGYVVYGAARRIELMDPIVRKGGKALYLDLCDDFSMRNCVETILKEQGRIDILINNAGFGLGGSIEDIPIEEVRKQFEVNVFGLGGLIRLVLPSMRNQRSGRIINIASMGGRFTTPFSGWYHATKYCVESISDALRMETIPFGIKVVVIEPGMIQTNWGVIHGKNILKFSGCSSYSTNAKAAAAYYENKYSSGRKLTDPKKVSEVIVKASVSNNPKTRYLVGKNSRAFTLFKKIFSDRLFDFLCLASLNQKK